MKSKNTSIEQYIKKYCIDQRIRDRKQLYVSSEVHETINNIADLFASTHVTALSLVDTILKEHIATHKETLNTEAERQHKAFLEELNSKNNIE